jgi:hypothetical protein
MSRVLELGKMPGIKDLPITIRVKLIKALIAEEENKTEEAEEFLAQGVEAEAKLAAMKQPR